ncbi:MAG: glycosyltransferase family 39 protein [Phycisphaeraceae bacterium]
MNDNVVNELGLPHWIVRKRWVLFGLVGLMCLLAFNGQWRVGRDSAMYRQLGHNLVMGEGYVYHGEHHNHLYPGLPLMLGGLEYAFGPSPIPPLLVNLTLAVFTLVLVYRLVRLTYPPWVAVTVTVLTGLNVRFQQYTSDILTDVPFLFATCLTLYALERLRQSASLRQWVVPIALLLTGLFVAASMRPTMWALAAALVGACVFGLIAGPRRFSLACLGVMLVAAIGWFAVDPRTSGFNPFAGQYETQVLSTVTNLSQLPKVIGLNIIHLFEEHMPDAFFGTEIGPGLNTLLTIIIIGGGIALLRHNVLWGLMVLITLAMTLVLLTVPRYFLMILPLLVLGWVLCWWKLALRLRQPYGDWVLTAALLLALLPNLGNCVKLVIEQRSVPFLERYKHGDWIPVIQLSEAIRQQVGADEKVSGPHTTVMTYLSGRPVSEAGDLVPRGHAGSWPGIVKAHGLDWAVFPSTSYHEDSLTREFIERGVIVPTGNIVREGDLWLARVEVRVTDEHWRDLPATPVIEPPTNLASQMVERPVQ